jgi:ATP synthase protein I
MFGLVGWAVSIPMVLGTALGVWVDREFPSRYSWTLMGLMAGVIWGCLNAWTWVKRESRRED